MEKLTDVDKLRFYRDEIKHEFNLLAMRSTILVTCQSFLVVPLAILQTAQNYRAALFYIYLVAALGLFTVLILLSPLHATHQTINKWLGKQRLLFKQAETLKDLALDRDFIPGAAEDSYRDRAHKHSLAFSIYGPWAFIIFWIIVIAWSTLRLFRL
jgi:hypothetical protein